MEASKPYIGFGCFFYEKGGDKLNFIRLASLCLYCDTNIALCKESHQHKC